MAKELKAGAQAPDFTSQNQDEAKIGLSHFKEKWIVLYFYPKDNTPGCTIEANDFTKYVGDFQKMNAVILGVSPDSCKSHVKFIKDQKLRIALLSYPEHKVAEAYGFWQLKEFMGKKFYGIARSTVLIDPDGKIAYLWTKIQAKGHAEEVRAKLKELQMTPQYAG